MDAVVIGGGPAGSAVARLLASWGHEVALLGGPPSRRPALAESLPPSCRKPLAALGMLGAVEGAGFLPNRGNSAAWGGGPLRALPFGGGAAGFQVVRQRLDAVLLGGAEAAGARILRGASARTVELPRDDAGDTWAEVRWEGPAGEGRLRARWVLDASGRTGVVARHGLRHRAEGPATVALVGVWRGGVRGWALDDESHTVVESYADGWAWSVPIDPERRYVALMVDPRASALSRAEGLPAMYRSEIARTVHLRRLLADATPEGAPWACGATPYGASRHAGPGFLLVGDAGSFLDPLSSVGVKKALASGWLAAVAVHTCLTRPSMRDAALSLFEERERAAHERYRVLAARHYAEAAEHHPGPFWTARAAAADGAPRSTGAAPFAEEFEAGTDAALLRHPRLAASLEYLRRSSPLCLRPAPGLRRDWRPTVRGREVVLEEHLVAPAVPDGIRAVRGVELPGLLEMVGAHAEVPDLYAAFAQSRPHVQLPDFLCALSAMLAAGILVGAGDTP